MKKSSLVLCIILMMGFSMPFSAVGQDTDVATNAVMLTVNGSALLAIRTGAISLSLSGAAEAGAAIQTVAADSTTRLRISSLVDGSTKRTISAKLDQIPTGTNLLITVKAPNGNFYGTDVQGTLLSNVTLTTGDLPIVTGIGTCWSGTGTDDGYVIKYTYRLIDGATDVRSNSLTVTYTLSDPA